MLKQTFRLIMFLSALLTVAFTPLAAQQGSQRADSIRAAEALKRLSPMQLQILERLRNSGLSREQVRQRLRDAGYDPNLADRYFDELTQPDSAANGSLSRITRPVPPPSSGLLSALKRIGVLQPEDSITVANMPRPDTLGPRARTVEKDKEPEVFGREVFAASTQFEPVLTGPVNPDYRLGPGDQMMLIVTGDVELAYELEVTREGFIVIPDVGQVIVNGLTMEQAKRRLNERLARVYSGMQIGTTQADVTMGRLRNKLVYVIGEVEVPGAYQLNGAATVFSALYRAGGPAISGSFRNLEVRRGDRVVAKVDLYDYLMRGDKSGDLAVEQGDVLFVPLVGPQVTVTGSVRRPAIFEMKGNEGLADVLRFAGGAQANAAIERIQVDRILPASQRMPGRERVLVDVRLQDLNAGASVAMQDGDRITISAITTERRNRVSAAGDVQRPGEYEYRPGMTALQLIQAANGLLPTAYTPTAHVIRLNPADSSRVLVRVSFDDTTSANYAGRVPLADLDELVVFGRAKLANPQRVEVFGYVKQEGTYSYSAGMTVEDVILLAGGFKEGALEAEVELARRVQRTNNSDSLAVIYRVPLNIGGPSKSSEAAPIRLQDGDQVFVRRLPGYAPLSTVEILGEVTYPGTYTVDSRKSRLSDLIQRAGGMTQEAYRRGLRLFRDGKPVGVNVERALSRPHSADDLMIEAGDRIEIPRIDPTVLVTGAVLFESRVRYERGLSVNDYLARAGGVTDEGNAAKAAVRYPNGELRTARSVLGFRDYPSVEPGSTITVPVKSERAGFNWDTFVTRTITTLSGLATIWLTVRAID
jgi:polysaccharide export outer membrane protein